MQKKHLTRDLSEITDDQLWKETVELRETAVITFIELGRRLKELQERHANRKNGNFAEKYTDLGFKKGEVYTLIKKYELYREDNTTNILIGGESSTENNVRTAEVITERIDGASQKVTDELSKAPPEIREKYYNGELNTANEIKEAMPDKEFIEFKNNINEIAVKVLKWHELNKFTEEVKTATTYESIHTLVEKYNLNRPTEDKKVINPGEIIKPAIIEDDRGEIRVRELTKELKDIDSEINELLESERKIKRLREQRAEVVEELSKAKNLKLI
jgi:hypothetical protein